MTEEAFIRSNAERWHELESRLKKGRPRDFDAMTSLNALRQSVIRNLAYAQTHFPDSEVGRYLNELAGKAYVVTEHTRRARKRPARFFLGTLPRNALAYKWFWLSAMGLFFLSFLFAYLFTHFNPGTAGAFLPSEYLSVGENPGGGAAGWDSAVMSSSIMVNNIMVSVLAFAYGITLGVGTLYVLVQNGLLIGSLAALVTDAGHGVLFWSLILPHGVFELFAIFLSAGAGLSVGYAFMRPEPYSRGDALKKTARDATKTMTLVCILLVIAAIIEGYITPGDMPVWVKYGFAGLCLLLLSVYLWQGQSRRKSAQTAASLS